jgi:serine O-acetyltransferase
VGTGARILGDVRLGDRCRVGANAVVVHSFPDDAVLVGVPARNIRQKD